MEVERQLKSNDFEPLVGELFTFGVRGGQDKIEGVLERVQELPSNGYPEELRKPFSLDFKMPPGANVGQCLLWVKTESRPDLPDMFLIPRGADEEGWYMEATFH